MSLKEKLTQILFQNFFTEFLQKMKFPGLDDLSVYDVLEFYGTGISKGTLGDRASAIAFNLFMSAFPLLILVFALLPYLPHYDALEDYIFDYTLKAIFPEKEIFDSVSKFIHENIAVKKFEVLSTSMILTLFFSTNGVKSLIGGFKNSYHFNEKFGFFKQYFISFLLTIGFILILFASLLFVYYGQFVWQVVEKVNPLENNSTLISILSFLVSFVLFWLMYSVLYYFGANFKIAFRWSVPGAFLSSLLFFLTLFLFGYYIKSFASNNLFYGSIGTVIVVMIWIQINVLITLIGYEFNLAIGVAKNSREKNS